MSRPFGLGDSVPPASRWRRLTPSRGGEYTSGRAWRIVAIAVAVVVLVAGWLGLDDFLTTSISRDDVQREGARAMLFSGSGGASLTCPGGLERTTGAKIVCTYTDTVAETIRAAMQLEHPPPPKVGRVEIRITGWHTPGGIDNTPRPEFGARVIERPR